MYIYVFLVAISSLVAGIVIAARSKKVEGVVYGALDKVGIITNILLIPAYAIEPRAAQMPLIVGSSKINMQTSEISPAVSICIAHSRAVLRVAVMSKIFC